MSLDLTAALQEKNPLVGETITRHKSTMSTSIRLKLMQKRKGMGVLDQILARNVYG